MKTRVVATPVSLAWMALVPALSFGQALGSSSVAGVVRDTSGAVMPGVTVEAASPALIEKVRTVVTDSQGLYTIISLRPGLYTVTFALAGFNTVKRDGIDLPANFTATVNAELRVGTLEETITVSGAAPLVDARNVVSQRVFTRDVLDAIPTATGFQSRAQLIPGIVVGNGAASGTQQDVGGGSGETFGSLTFHGNHGVDFQPFFDGMSVSNGARRDSYGYQPNNGIVQEVAIEGGGQDAEHEFSGVYSNLIPKDGSNVFRGSFVGSNTTSGWQANNLSPDLIDRGLKAVNHVKHYWDFNPTGGGPLIKDRLWFYTGYRHWGIDSYIAGVYLSTAPQSVYPACYGAQVPGCTPAGEQLFSNLYHYSIPLRLSWQVSPRNKVTLFGEHQFTLSTGGAALSSPEASNRSQYNPQYLVEATWSSPLTNRLLLQAAIGAAVNDPFRYRRPGTPLNVSAITELSTGFNYRANPSTGVGGGYGRFMSDNFTYKASAAYVTGTHNTKGGIQITQVWSDIGHDVNNSLSYQFRNGRPANLVQWTTGYTALEFLQAAYDVGLYAQDQWVIKKLTLNLGTRLDHVNAWVKPQHEGAGPFAPVRDYPRVSDVPNFWSLNPRFGAAYDLFGNGKTAIKATLGRYAEPISSGQLTYPVNPLQATVLSVTRTWTDPNFPNDLVNGDVFPNCDLNNPLANGDCGQISDLNFGDTGRVTTRYDDSVIKGFQNQGYNWETSVSLQHELIPNLSVNTGYFRRWYGNPRINQNVALTPGDYTTFCVTAPVDARLPGGGGNQVCGFYDVNPIPFATVVNQNVITSPDSLGQGKAEEVYDGVDLSANARLPKGITLSGGLNTGRTRFNTCYTLTQPNVTPLTVSALLGLSTANVAAAGATSPRNNDFCDLRPPFLTQFKGFAVYPLPWFGLMTSATIQSIPGNPVYAGRVYSSAEIAPSLGRNLSAGANGTVILDLVPQGKLYTDRLNQVDLRMSKVFKARRARITANFDLYNLFNANTVLSVNTRYGSSWLQPTLILGGRLAKAGVQVDF